MIRFKNTAVDYHQEKKLGWEKKILKDLRWNSENE